MHHKVHDKWKRTKIWTIDFSKFLNLKNLSLAGRRTARFLLAGACDSYVACVALDGNPATSWHVPGGWENIQQVYTSSSRVWQYTPRRRKRAKINIFRKKIKGAQQKKRTHISGENWCLIFPSFKVPQLLCTISRQSTKISLGRRQYCFQHRRWVLFVCFSFSYQHDDSWTAALSLMKSSTNMYLVNF